jgi:DNA invertase Pin-like site-specific DNA recombinase
MLKDATRRKFDVTMCWSIDRLGRRSCTSETDPVRDVCYLHGMLERRGGDNSTERFNAFFATNLSAMAARGAFARACAYQCARTKS